MPTLPRHPILGAMERGGAGERFRVVIAGGGVAALEAALALQALAEGFVDVELVDSREGVARTKAGAAIAYDALLLACGASPVPAVRGAITFRGPSDTA